MNALIIGCGRVGSTIALQLHRDGWDVTVVDEKEDALSRLGEAWPGRFVVGHGMDVDLLRDVPVVLVDRRIDVAAEVQRRTVNDDEFRADRLRMCGELSSISIETLVDANCGYRGLEPGLPAS